MLGKSPTLQDQGDGIGNILAEEISSKEESERTISLFEFRRSKEKRLLKKGQKGDERCR